MPYGSKPSVNLAYALNAMHPSHLALPRAVGPYAVVRTTRVFTSDRETNLFGTFLVQDANGNERWSNTCRVTNAVGMDTTAINAANSAELDAHTSMSGSAWDASTVTPSAFTVQIMGGAPISTAFGMAFAGRAHTMPQLGGTGQDWADAAANLVSFNAPRMLSGGKLSLRGVQVNAIPMNMADLARFTPPSIDVDQVFTWDNAGTGPRSLRPGGFAPIFMRNTDKILLTFVCTTEWRVRFDPSNPAQGAHVLHQAASESTWQTVMNAAHGVAHGVEDIAEVTAAIGAAGASVAAAAGVLGLA